jgi:predicted amidohydrolase YtcJ
MRGGDAIRSGALVTFHNDGMVSPPIPLLNMESMVTRRTPSGTLHGPDQQMSLNDAIKAHTINAARQLGREKDLGSLAVGKRADLVELSADPYSVDSNRLTDQVKVLGTWVNGRKVNTDAFISDIEAIDPTEHKGLHAAAMSHTC